MITKNLDVNLIAVGIDPAKEKHRIVAMIYPERILLDEEYKDTLQDYYRIRDDIRSISNGNRVIFGLEDTSNYGRNLCRFLLSEGEKVKEVNTMLTSRQRDSYGEDKDDSIDARSAASVVLSRHQELPSMAIPEDSIQAIRELSRYREQLVKEKTRLLNQLHNYLHQAYLNYKELFPELERVSILSFLQQYPIVSSLRGKAFVEIKEFLMKHSHGRLSHKGANTLTEKILARQNAQIMPSFPLLEESRGFIISDLAKSILAILKTLKEIEEKLEKLIPLSGYQSLCTFPGVKTVNASRIIGETISSGRFQDDRNRFAKYNGTAPVIVKSGNKEYHKKNNRCNHLLKKTFYLISLSAYRHSELSKEYIQRQIKSGYSSKQALVHLSRRISDIIFAMMRDKKPYDSSIFKERLVSAELN